MSDSKCVICWTCYKAGSIVAHNDLKDQEDALQFIFQKLGVDFPDFEISSEGYLCFPFCANCQELFKKISKIQIALKEFNERLDNFLNQLRNNVVNSENEENRISNTKVTPTTNNCRLLRAQIINSATAGRKSEGGTNEKNCKTKKAAVRISKQVGNSITIANEILTGDYDQSCIQTYSKVEKTCRLSTPVDNQPQHQQNVIEIEDIEIEDFEEGSASYVVVPEDINTNRFELNSPQNDESYGNESENQIDLTSFVPHTVNIEEVGSGEYARNTQTLSGNIQNTPKKSVNYFCLQCGEKFGAILMYQRHIQTAHQIQILEPQVKSNMEQNLFLQRDEKTLKRSLRCLACVAKFRTVFSFQRHMERKHGAKVDKFAHLINQKVDDSWKEKFPTQCTLCHKVFKAFEGRVRHEILFHPELLVHSCQICENTDAKYTIKEMLSTHMKIHSVSDSDNFTAIKCDVCGRYLNRSDVENHLEKHKGPKVTEEKCPKCSRVFSCKTHLSRHLKVTQCSASAQVKQKKVKLPQECPVCKKVFTDFKTHLRTHSNEKVICHFCGKKIGKASLSAHIRFIHRGGERKTKTVTHAQCELCGLVCREKYLKIHMEVKHGETTSYRKFECYFCKMRCVNVAALEKHLSVHTREKAYKCHLCFVRLGYIQNLRAHLKTVHNK